MTESSVSGKRVVVWLIASVIAFSALVAVVIRVTADETKPKSATAKLNSTLRDPPEHWWNNDAPCPIGAALRESKAPKTMWCELPNGTKHGFYTRWQTEQLRDRRGEFNHGKRAGLWTTWHKNGRPASRVGFVDGVQTTDLVRWDPTGALTRVKLAPTR